MCADFEPLLKAINRYIEKADRDMSEVLRSSGRVLPEESVKVMSSFEDETSEALTAQTEYFIEKIKNKKSISDIMSVMEEIKAKDAYCEEIGNALSRQLTTFMPKLVKEYVANVDGGIRITDLTKRTTSWIHGWSGELGRLMKLTSYNEIEQILSKGLWEGKSVAEVSQDIMNSGIRNPFWKARRVAVTEMLRAHNVARQEAAMQNPSVIAKTWRHTGSYKNEPRENHVEMDGQTVPKNETFTLIGADGMLYYPMYPVDGTLPAGESINCHCIAIEVIDDKVLGLSAEERQKMRDEAVAEMDDEWERALDEKYRTQQEQGNYSGDEIIEIPAKISVNNPENSGIIEAEKLAMSDFPAAFSAKNVEAKNTQMFIDFVNSREGANPDSVALYKSMGKAFNLDDKGISFKISHGLENSLQTVYSIAGPYKEMKLTIPKLSGDGLMGQANITLHEEMHFMDVLLSEENRKWGFKGKWFSESFKELTEQFSKTDTSIGPNAKKLIDNYAAEMQNRWDKENSALGNINARYLKGEFSTYKEYDKEFKKARREMRNNLTIQAEDIMGGGVGHFADIYDALTGGKVQGYYYGHGAKYYSDFGNRIKETLANYGALSVTRPDLIELLREDKPGLVNALENTVKEMLKTIGDESE